MCGGLFPLTDDMFASPGGWCGCQLADAINDETRAIEIYQQQISELESEAEKSESLGLTRKREAERKRL